MYGAEVYHEVTGGSPEVPSLSANTRAGARPWLKLDPKYC